MIHFVMLMLIANHISNGGGIVGPIPVYATMAECAAAAKSAAPELYSEKAKSNAEEQGYTGYSIVCVEVEKAPVVTLNPKHPTVLAPGQLEADKSETRKL